LKKRSNAPDALDFWFKLIRNKGFKPPTVVHSDGEFKSKKIQAIFKMEGTTWEPTAPDSPWQDGVSGATFKIILQKGPRSRNRRKFAHEILG
jgi:hypothetical protein